MRHFSNAWWSRRQFGHLASQGNGTWYLVSHIHEQRIHTKDRVTSGKNWVRYRFHYSANHRDVVSISFRRHIDLPIHRYYITSTRGHHRHGPVEPRDTHSSLFKYAFGFVHWKTPLSFLSRKLFNSSGFACEEELYFLLQGSANCRYRRATRPTRSMYGERQAHYLRRDSELPRMCPPRSDCCPQGSWWHWAHWCNEGQNNSVITVVSFFLVKYLHKLTLLYFIVLHCTSIPWTVLQFTVLYSTVLFCDVDSEMK